MAPGHAGCLIYRNNSKDTDTQTDTEEPRRRFLLTLEREEQLHKTEITLRQLKFTSARTTRPHDVATDAGSRYGGQARIC